MKKILAVILAVLMLLSMAACSSGKNSSGPSNTTAKLPLVKEKTCRANIITTLAQDNENSMILPFIKNLQNNQV